VVLGGVIKTQNSVNVQQVPLLGDIPLLGNLFKRRGVSTETQELIFFTLRRSSLHNAVPIVGLSPGLDRGFVFSAYGYGPHIEAKAFCGTR